LETFIYTILVPFLPRNVSREKSRPLQRAQREEVSEYEDEQHLQQQQQQQQPEPQFRRSLISPTRTRKAVSILRRGSSSNSSNGENVNEAGDSPRIGSGKLKPITAKYQV